MRLVRNGDYVEFHKNGVLYFGRIIKIWVIGLQVKGYKVQKGELIPIVEIVNANKVHVLTEETYKSSIKKYKEDKVLLA